MDSRVFTSQDGMQTDFHGQHTLGATDDAPTLLGIAHRYRTFDFAESDAAGLLTNGHLHKLSFYWLTQTKRRSRHWLFALAPHLSVSSNQLQQPDLIEHDAWQLHGRLQWRRQWRQDLWLSLGLCIDDRLTDYRAYPMVAANWRPSDALHFDVGFPTTRIALHPSDTWRLQINLDAAGGEWRVYDKASATYSDFHFRAWRAELGMTANLASGDQIGLFWGREFRRRWRYALSDGATETGTGESAALVSLRLARSW